METLIYFGVFAVALFIILLGFMAAYIWFEILPRKLDILRLSK